MNIDKEITFGLEIEFENFYGDLVELKDLIEFNVCNDSSNDYYDVIEDYSLISTSL